jgi:hypothetical protein
MNIPKLISLAFLIVSLIAVGDITSSSLSTSSMIFLYGKSSPTYRSLGTTAKLYKLRDNLIGKGPDRKREAG